jgi:hypothetical protein
MALRRGDFLRLAEVAASRQMPADILVLKVLIAGTSVTGRGREAGGARSYINSMYNFSDPVPDRLVIA